MVSVIVCTYNRADSLKCTLDSLQKMRGVAELAWELVIVDNNCRDDTEQVVREYQAAVAFSVVYVRETRQGLSHARNRGIAVSRGTILAFTDDDVTVDAEWLWQLHAAYARFDCAGIAGKIVPAWTRDKPSWLTEEGPYAVMKAIVNFDQGDQPCELKTPPFGANMSFRRTAFAQHGLFRTDLGRRGTELFCGDDTEFGRRLLAHGERLLYEPTLVVYHRVADERLRRAYFRRWYYYYGRTTIRLARSRGDAGSMYSPTGLLRALCATTWRSLTAGNAQRRFHASLFWHLVLGQIREAIAPRTRTIE